MWNTVKFVILWLLLAQMCRCQKTDSDTPAYFTIQEHLNKEDTKSGIQRELRVEDFFWSGSGDGPPEFVKKVHSTAKDGKEVIIKTETLIATVYVEGQNDEDMLCLDCIRTANGLPNNITTDRRYWLLTVVGGFLRPNDVPLVEGNLAKLYRIAFTRQQSFHLGIANNNNLTQKSNMVDRTKRQIMFNFMRYKRRVKRSVPPDIDDESDNHDTFAQSDDESDKAELFDPSNPEQDIRIYIHNITMITEDDVQNWDSSYDDVIDQRNSRPMANQTEIIYSVFLNGNPVLAQAAAEDMKLVSESEVISVMKKEIYMKAEPYLKEPQATPLVPASKNGTAFVFNILNNHPIMIAVSSVIILLLIVLFIALLFMTRAKRIRSAEVKRLTSRQGLLSHRSDGGDLTTNRTMTEATISRVELDDGIDNAAFIYDRPAKSKNDNRKRDYPTIDFPRPPPLTQADSTSTTSTSDSSVYCPVNKPDLDLQAMLDDKANRLFDKKKRGTLSEVSETVDHTYMAATKKRDKRNKTKSRIKRKYLAENRVGSIEDTAQVHSTQGSYSTDSLSDSLKPDFENFEHNEAFNPNNHYHRNKILDDHMFTDKVYDTIDPIRMSPTQAINREIIKALEPGEKTSESGSIGSFLSMASIKSFPKQQMPEPLNRVLEPVSVTHYDYYDNPATNVVAKKPRQTKTVTLVDHAKCAQSDTPDPGVIGPIVWEVHKKRMAADQKGSNQILDSPMRDPALTRNRFEGLLEGAIQMYEADSSPKCSPKKGMTGTISRRKDNRGKSAAVPSLTRLSRSNSANRPVTAGPTKSHSNNSSQPPTPNSRAWGSSGAPSPLVRPLSAGPFHCPEPPTVDVTRVLAHQSTDKSQLSAAPLIEAIQNELKKFKRENTKD